jgi:hypothetical protein
MCTSYIPTETREHSLLTESEISFVIPARKKVLHLSKRGKCEVEVRYKHFLANFSITDYNRQVKVIYCLDHIMHQV